MPYIINQSIVFSPTEKMLYILNEKDLSLTLSNPATRLLLELVKNNKETITRQHLVKHVWEDYGFNGSNNNLNGCISEIRKAIEALEPGSHIITTLPKVGFILDANIETFLPSPDADNIAVPQCDALINILDKRPVQRNKRTMLTGLIVMIYLGGIVFTWTVLQSQRHGFSDVDAQYLYQQNQCEVFTLGSHYLYSKTELIEYARKDLSREGIDCDSARTNVFYARTEKRNMPFQATFIAACAQSPQGDYGYCQTINTYGAAT
ncbi:winged helix-turn-helix domain-containing protein [Serratia entomophila]|uniref:winged helix-turn-helix domain-containing protein n=1 Tax=Serratia entomophila TaxID=42906 RepID=UPI00217849E5|nr:winged helix-turn-helix domain-containing protein [Serratia entomophila]CAI0798471.1 Transcriptional regulatory protein, C terminal [Serratia entomophila]CAI1562390.1 Transcriptional regulatory protein, C terminal [Serratia entomophila]CAI1571627.1 Transcriptional regulatory protein, C terminal [Serratia entomophila]CAI1613299.1 Transcriptional regulatory protein, C terminal [Serratia entomophila]CAI1685543.1 Transcriptional regulatory protein, C terminal [Serratia entomophila]